MNTKTVNGVIIITMQCPKCQKPMRKVRWEVTNNFKTGNDFKEYDKYTYECRDDDIWVTTETPLVKKNTETLTDTVKRNTRK